MLCTGVKMHLSKRSLTVLGLVAEALIAHERSLDSIV